MRFKYFLLNEAFNTNPAQAGDILSSLESIKLDIDNLDKKQILEYLNELLIKIRGIINPKTDKVLVVALQKIGCAIIDDIKQNNDFKDTIDGSIFELQNYFQKSKIPVNQPVEVSKDIKGLGKPIKSNKKSTKEPRDISSNKELEQIPGGDTQDLYQPPLSGTGDKLNPVI